MLREARMLSDHLSFSLTIILQLYMTRAWLGGVMTADLIHNACSCNTSALDLMLQDICYSDTNSDIHIVITEKGERCSPR